MVRYVTVSRRARRSSVVALVLAAFGPLVGCSSSEGADPGASSGEPAADGSVVQGVDGGEVAPANGVRDGDETDVDCGGARAPACSDGRGCGAASDCASGVCAGSVCQPPAATDGVKNGDETGVDCGGSSGKRCATGQGCATDADCDQVKCDTAQKTCAPVTASDGLKNGDETDVDCGGSAPKCAQGKACLADADCAGNVRCDAAAKTCNAPASDDGLKNGTETDVDCGGGAPTNAPKCPAGEACTVPADCVDGACTGNVCVAPRNDDGLKNGNESDVDCGSSGPGTNTSAPACDAGKACTTNADCKSAGCNHEGVCAYPRSCAIQHGGTTCGTGDTTSAANQHEDCCASAVVPAYNEEGYANPTAFRLDKYQITSGRLRRFLDAVSGNVQGWVIANRASVLAPDQLPPAMDGYLPTGWTQADSNDDCRPDGTAPGDRVIRCNYGALNQVNGYRYNNDPGGDAGYGCYMATGGYGSNTFYLTDAERLHSGENAHEVSRARLEEKSMTCGTYFIYAAFCAWDGGRLETWDEYNAAYGGNGTIGRVYPWGSASASRAIGFADLFSHIVAPTTSYGYTPPADPVNGQYSVFNVNLTAQQRADLLVRVDRANLRWNYYNAQLLDYRAPLQGRGTVAVAAETGIDVANDQSVAVAPPGRYPEGAGRYGHRDLLGNVMETLAGVVNTDRRRWSRNGSFETAHFNAANMTGVNGYNFPPLTKYGRAGARCARPMAIYPAAPLPEAP